MKPPLNVWLILHAAVHASTASTEQLFLLVTEPRSGSDWLVDLLDAHPNVCVPAGRWAEKGSGDKHNGIDGHALVGVTKAKTLNASGTDVGAAYEAAADYRLAHPLKGPKDDNRAGVAWPVSCPIAIGNDTRSTRVNSGPIFAAMGAPRAAAILMMSQLLLSQLALRGGFQRLTRTVNGTGHTGRVTLSRFYCKGHDFSSCYSPPELILSLFLLEKLDSNSTPRQRPCRGTLGSATTRKQVKGTWSS